MNGHQPLGLNAAWASIMELLGPMEERLFGPGPDDLTFATNQYTMLYTRVYLIYIQKPPFNLAPDLYRRLGIHIADVAREAFANNKQKHMDVYANRIKHIFKPIQSSERSYVRRLGLPLVEDVVRAAFRTAASVEMEIGATFVIPQRR